MNDLRKQFLRDSAGKLSEIIHLVSGETDLSAADRNHVLRTLHTIKGTAQTFGLENAGRLAHDIESGFQSNVSNEELVKVLISLKKGLETGEFADPGDARRTIIKEEIADSDLSFLPEKYRSQMSASEIAKLGHGYSNNVCFEIYRAEFEISEFAKELTKERKIFESYGEIIAAFPSSTPAAADSIAFEFLLKTTIDRIATSRERAADALARFDMIHSSASKSIDRILEYLKNEGERLARNTGKTVEFRVSTAVDSISEEISNTLFSSLMHLIRNSVDHAFTDSGVITIDIKKSDKNLEIFFSDSGIGIDAAKLIESAKELKILKENESISNSAALRLIFEPGFTTAKSVTETSGRGIGLNAVKEIVERSGGQISVKSEAENGTMFQIVLPVQ